ncbi:CC-NBS-LRR resistance protein, partial [Trifolium medium]|nr:CC-NBS-LRR resistance protein [Trifolium medium]
LRDLSVGKVEGVLWNTSWERYTSLSELQIRSDDIVKVLMKTDVPLLPPNLVILQIANLEDIECLDGKWLQHLTSLHKLEIWDAPKLKLLPKEGLPSSLKVLDIQRCPLLNASLRRKQGKEWRKIAHIAFVFIDVDLLGYGTILG